MKNISLISLYFIFGILIFLSVKLNVDMLNIENYEPLYKYYTEDSIQIIYTIKVILLLIILFVLIYNIIFLLLDKNILFKISSIILFVCSFAILFLLWYEFYHGTNFYYGEVRDKQSLNLYIIGPSLWISMAISYLLSKKIKFRALNFYIFPALFIGVYIIQKIIFISLQDKWRLWSS